MRGNAPPQFSLLTSQFDEPGIYTRTHTPINIIGNSDKQYWADTEVKLVWGNPPNQHTNYQMIIGTTDGSETESFLNCYFTDFKYNKYAYFTFSFDDSAGNNAQTLKYNQKDQNNDLLVQGDMRLWMGRGIKYDNADPYIEIQKIPTSLELIAEIDGDGNGVDILERYMLDIKIMTDKTTVIVSQRDQKIGIVNELDFALKLEKVNPDYESSLKDKMLLEFTNRQRNMNPDGYLFIGGITSDQYVRIEFSALPRSHLGDFGISIFDYSTYHEFSRFSCIYLKGLIDGNIVVRPMVYFNINPDPDNIQVNAELHFNTKQSFAFDVHNFKNSYTIHNGLGKALAEKSRIETMTISFHRTVECLPTTLKVSSIRYFHFSFDLSSMEMLLEVLFYTRDSDKPGGFNLELPEIDSLIKDGLLSDLSSGPVLCKIAGYLLEYVNFSMTKINGKIHFNMGAKFYLHQSSTTAMGYFFIRIGDARNPWGLVIKLENEMGDKISWAIQGDWVDKKIKEGMVGLMCAILVFMVLAIIFGLVIAQPIIALGALLIGVTLIVYIHFFGTKIVTYLFAKGTVNDGETHAPSTINSQLANYKIMFTSYKSDAYLHLIGP